MKTQRNVARLPAILLLVVLVAPALLAGCGKTMRDTMDDATITVRVKTALLNDPEIAGMGIAVDTFKGVVTLSGRVRSAAEEAKAIQIAKSLNGVTDVKSTLQVQP